MVAILQTTVPSEFYSMIWLNFVPKGSIDNKSAMVQVMVWSRTGDKPLAEAVMIQCDETYLRHLASMS